MFIESEAIVIKRVKYKEEDLIVTLFSPKVGKISAIATGGQKLKNKYFSSCQLFSYSKFGIKKTSGLYRLVHSELKNNFYNLSQDVNNFYRASYIMDLISKIIIEDQSYKRLFYMSLEILKRLQKNSDQDLLIRVFELKLLDFLGIKPEIYKCSSCGNQKFEKFAFSSTQGGLICEKCMQLELGQIFLDASTISLMRFILKNDIETIEKATISPILINDLKKVNINYLKTHIESYDESLLKFVI